MRADGELILGLLAIVGLGGPLLLGLTAVFWPQPPRAASGAPGWGLRLMLSSTLLYALAFNLVFFVQELFLVWPKALTPGLEPVLFHNNHDWTGDNPLAELLQGTGALAILTLGVAASLWLTARPPRNVTVRLLLVWVAFHGLFQSLPQGVVGAAVPQNDVGRAMSWFGLSPPVLLAAALASLAAMAVAGIWLSRPLLSLATAPGEVENRWRRTRFVLMAGALPAALGTLLVLPFRVPGSIDQVVIVPVAVAVLGSAWMLAGAWTAKSPRTPGADGLPAVALPVAALLLVLAVFQLVLRPGIAF